MKSPQTYESLVVEANAHVVLCDDAAIEYSSAVDATIADNAMTVGSPACCSSNTMQEPVIHLPYNPDCKKYTINEGGSLTLPSSMKYTPEMEISAHAGIVVADAIDTYKLILNTSSGAKVTLGGHANVVIAQNTSGSQCDCRYLICGGVKAAVNSGAELEVTVQDRIVAYSPNGKITYYCLRDVQADCKGNVTKHIIEL